MAEPLHVSVYDPETGEQAEVKIPPGSYLVLCVQPCHEAEREINANGTVQITLKGVRNPIAGAFQSPQGGGSGG